MAKPRIASFGLFCLLARFADFKMHAYFPQGRMNARVVS